ncbi:MAG: 1-acyl-sn-glycerol-3-phosphate acyltransferase [Clostridia bacterium]|nr:1-acyl-sn-glycerol-3-phosphate acyltransferase [Clostridia bacterium]
MKVYAVLKKILKGLFMGLFRVDFQGAENIPAEGPLLVCPNHLSNWDPIILGAACDRQIRFMAKASLFKIPLLNVLIKTLGAFPIQRGMADPGALKTAIKHLKDGDAVGVFPQGKRYMNVEPKDTGVKPGIGMIAYRSKADVLPISIVTEKYKIMPFRKVYIRVGKVIPYADLKLENGTQEEYSVASEYVFKKVLELIYE